MALLSSSDTRADQPGRQAERDADATDGKGSAYDGTPPRPAFGRVWAQALEEPPQLRGSTGMGAGTGSGRWPEASRRFSLGGTRATRNIAAIEPLRSDSNPSLTLTPTLTLIPARTPSLTPTLWGLWQSPQVRGQRENEHSPQPPRLWSRNGMLGRGR